MSGQTKTTAADVDNTRSNRWECAICGAIGPNIEYDTLDEHAQDNHPEKWEEYQKSALGIDDDVSIAPIVGAIFAAMAASVGVFVLTWSLLLAIGGYMFTACLVYAVLWVVGYA